MEIFIPKKAKFAIDLEGLLNLPASVYWKDLQGAYLGCNDVMAEIVSAQSRSAIKDVDDIELVGSEAAEPIIAVDREVITQMRPQIVEEILRDSNGSIITKGLSTKAPLYDTEGKLVGIWGISILTDRSVPQVFSAQTRLPDIPIINVAQRLANKSPPPTRSHTNLLSGRERECLILLAKGLSAKEISNELGLSKRTIESYIDNIKAKLGCINKTELIIAAIKYRYINLETL